MSWFVMFPIRFLGNLGHFAVHNGSSSCDIEVRDTIGLYDVAVCDIAVHVTSQSVTSAIEFLGNLRDFFFQKIQLPT